MSEFNQLADQILESLWKNSPYVATFVGIHEYDQELDNVDADYLISVNNERKDFLNQLEALDEKKLTPEEHIDWQLLKNFLRSNTREFEEIRYWQKNPAEYANLCVDALHILFLREFAPIEERTAAILSRMKQIPRFLKDSKRNLKDTPQIFTKLAIETNKGGQHFLQTIAAKLGNLVPTIATDIEKASKEAAAAIDDYGRFLETKLLPESEGEFAIGAEYFNFKLKTDHMLPYTAEQILDYGHAQKRATEEALSQTARQIDKGKTWIQIVNDIKNHHPQASELLAAYKTEMERARKFIQDNDLVSIPPAETLEVIDTPAFYRPILPYAAYMNPAPFETQQKGYFFVTPVDENIPAAQQEEILRGHSFYGIPVTALHEGYPGHHLQLVHANYLKNKLRRILNTNVFIEGWALYCEEMMYDAGFYSDPRSRLLQLKDQLWRACRVIIDVQLHTKQMTYEEAVNLLVDCAKLQKVHAEKEVTRYTFSPTQPMSYLVGKRQIIELKEDYQKNTGEQFDLKKFHDRLLSFGSIPVCLIRREFGL
ncbi:MAG: DUF885 domain-containing protein [candidate division WOR-3 bacterium]